MGAPREPQDGVGHQTRDLELSALPTDLHTDLWNGKEVPRNWVIKTRNSHTWRASGLMNTSRRDVP